MFTTTRNLVRLAAALTLVAAFAVAPSAADAGNFKHRKFAHGHHHHKFFFKHHRHNHFGFHHHHFHRPYFVKPVFVGPAYPGQVIAVPYGNGVVYVLK